MESCDISAINKTANHLNSFAVTEDFGVIVDKILQYKLIGEYDEAVSLIDSILTGQGR
jgi:hypothetical protein